MASAASGTTSTIPLLRDLAHLPLPPPPPPLPGHQQSKAYALYRQRVHYQRILDEVTALAEPQIGAIQKLEDWDDKQEAVDVLFEDIEYKLQRQQVILGKHPHFGKWVERALEEFLRRTQAKAKKEAAAAALSGGTTDESSSSSKEEALDDDTDHSPPLPLFMDCFDPAVDSAEAPVPKILHPLKPKPERQGQSRGRMVEEWEMAAHRTTKRILLRQCTRRMAQVLCESEDNAEAARVYLHGRVGIGKTAAMLAVVASARKSGSIVVFVPEGDQFHQNGFYCVPNEKKKGIFDVPILTQGVCQDLLDMHREDMVSFQADTATMETHFTEDQLKSVTGYEPGGSIAVNDLLEVAVKEKELAPMCYSVVMDVLMNQDEKHFVLAFDEFNCYHAPGHYFHMAYDDFYKNPKSIPYDQISLFKPAMDAMAIYSVPEHDEDHEIQIREPVLMKRGAVIVGTSESKAIARRVTDGLTRSAVHDPGVHVIEVPRLSALEVEHVVANYECIGFGKLRLDQGETVMNSQEVAFLRMVSGAEPERLMNACIIDQYHDPNPRFNAP